MRRGRPGLTFRLASRVMLSGERRHGTASERDTSGLNGGRYGKQAEDHEPLCGCDPACWYHGPAGRPSRDRQSARGTRGRVWGECPRRSDQPSRVSESTTCGALTPTIGRGLNPAPRKGSSATAERSLCIRQRDHQGHRIDSGGDEAVALVEALRLVGDRMHEDGADSAELGGLQGPEDRVAQ